MHNNFEIRGRVHDIIKSGSSFCVVLVKKRKFKTRTLKTNVVLWSKDKSVLNELKIGFSYIFEFYLHGFNNVVNGVSYWNLKAYISKVCGVGKVF